MNALYVIAIAALLWFAYAIAKINQEDADRENKEGAENLERWMAREREIADQIAAKKQAEQ